MAKGMTQGRTRPLPTHMPRATAQWQQHPQPLDPLTTARNARKKRGRRDVERGEPRDSERAEGE